MYLPVYHFSATVQIYTYILEKSLMKCIELCITINRGEDLNVSSAIILTGGGHCQMLVVL